MQNEPQNFKCPKCGAWIEDRWTREDAQFDHDTATNCDGQVEVDA